MVDGQRFREVLPAKQIRLLSLEMDAERECLQPDQFVIGTFKVPNGYWSLKRSLSALILRQIEEKFQLRFISVLSQNIQFLWRSEEHSLADIERVVGIEFRNSKNYRKALYETNEDLEAAETELKRKKQLSTGPAGLALPLELLKEVFQSLDNIHRQRCRRTCQQWEAIIASPEVCRNVVVARYEAISSLRWEWNEDYALYNCVFKHIVPGTRTVCIRDTLVGEDHYGFLEGKSRARGYMDVIKNALDNAGIHVERLVVHQQCLSIGNPYNKLNLRAVFAVMAEQNLRLASCCDRMILKDYELTIVNLIARPFIRFRIPLIEVISLSKTSETEIWNVFENYLHSTTPALNMKHITQFTATLAECPRQAQRVIKILGNYQSCDPRPSAHYREHEWTLSNVAGVDVEKLNRLSLHVLSRHIKRGSFEIWDEMERMFSHLLG
ncbi:uncharacterized protein LOC129601787 [Paramacrobiotus metropolitanus]|uniref:uncharacterized protein LOC129601787 n=1 Tax=Paramacrobiotus metropolitanus TaxID=2943436 RepID=UPI0024462210|nr:uncharacterized protein LOC129601787 [Paramacrobiotus metropolitanus]